MIKSKTPPQPSKPPSPPDIRAVYTYELHLVRPNPLNTDCNLINLEAIPDFFTDPLQLLSNYARAVEQLKGGDPAVPLHLQLESPQLDES
jgi:hypothetical protein